ncbi:MAG: hypothetical protein KF891_21180 [Rhizobacter sp.]|nr:hypothetical protein [Rhizobacter sp.]
MKYLQPATDAHARRNAAMEFNTAWGVTMPADLATLPAATATLAPNPFREPIRGLVTREVDEPGLFEQFFG